MVPIVTLVPSKNRNLRPPPPEQQIIRWWGARQCKAAYVLRSLLLRHLQGTQSQRLCPQNQLVRTSTCFLAIISAVDQSTKGGNRRPSARKTSHEQFRVLIESSVRVNFAWHASKYKSTKQQPTSSVLLTIFFEPQFEPILLGRFYSFSFDFSQSFGLVATRYAQ